ncbi:MAG: haloacid dehalogenase-like hydrolase [Prevotella sp.]|nr:haloacid dehalogenase-like hydrolase [Prevotella sp.]
MSERQTVYIFDFDGTLTTKDTLLEFIRYAKGTGPLLLGFLLHAPLLVLMKLRLYPNYKAKQRLFSYYFKGMTLTDFNAVCKRFAHDNRTKLLRPQALDTLHDAQSHGHRILIVSASIDNWVRPFFPQSLPATPTPPDTSTAQSLSPSMEGRGGSSSDLSEGDITILGTQIETHDGLLTGRFLTPNCYGPEKVRRIEEVLTQPRDTYHIIAFGDSRGDKQLLAYANEAHYKPFRH